ncbi:C_GCAxxG_C_C family protein [bacterium]|nr:C_GCAxxG_C_C family protein [bacterium]
MKTKIQENAFQYFESGLHCAESIAKAILEHYRDNFEPEWIKAASAFQGGIGRCKRDACGAFTGGIVALGILKGRTDPETDHSEVLDLATQYRQRFIEKFGSTNCDVLLKCRGAVKTGHLRAL